MDHISTNKEQSRRLLACGVLKETADMYFGKAHVPPAEYYQYVVTEGIEPESWFSYRGNRDVIPAWSLTALIKLIPIDTYTVLKMIKNNVEWTVVYEQNLNVLFHHHNESIIEAVVRTVEDLKKMEKEKEKEKERFNERCDAYRRMYHGAKDENDLKNRINAFRSGKIDW